MRIPSGSTTKKVEFTALDETDLQTKEPGFGSTGWTVVSSRNGGADLTWTTPTVAEIDSVTMPGWYALTLDEDTTISEGAVEEPLGLRVTHAGMMPREFEVTIFENVYDADIDFRRDGTNSRDEYTVSWFKNGLPITSGITGAQIQVVKRADGTDLIAATNMTEIGSTGAYRYNEATNRMTDGEASVIVVTATVDGATRTARLVRGRDAA